MNVGAMIEKEIAKRGFTQRGFARESGVSHTAIQNLMNGKSRFPTLDNAKKMADVFGMTLVEFWNEAEKYD